MDKNAIPLACLYRRTNLYLSFIPLPTLVVAPLKLQEGQSLYNVTLMDTETEAKKYEGRVSFKGGIRKMLIKRRDRLTCVTSGSVDSGDLRAQTKKEKELLELDKIRLKRAETKQKMEAFGGASSRGVAGGGKMSGDAAGGPASAVGVASGGAFGATASVAGGVGATGPTDTTTRGASVGTAPAGRKGTTYKKVRTRVATRLARKRWIGQI